MKQHSSRSEHGTPHMLEHDGAVVETTASNTRHVGSRATASGSRALAIADRPRNDENRNPLPGTVNAFPTDEEWDCRNTLALRNGNCGAVLSG